MIRLFLEMFLVSFHLLSLVSCHVVTFVMFSKVDMYIVLWLGFSQVYITAKTYKVIVIEQVVG